MATTAMAPANNGHGAMTIADDHDSVLGSMVRPDAAVSTAIQLAAALVDKRISTARQFPRSIARFKAEAADLLREDVETARSAEYAKPVGGGTVKGPSVRLAELAAMCWGNLEVEVAEPVVGDKSVFVKATAWDLQRNYRQDGTASMSIINRQGQRYPGHMIETTCAATAAKAKRNAIMAVIPRAYIADLLGIAKQVAGGNEKPLEQRRHDALDFFARTYKVTAEQVFALLSVNGIDDITGEHIDDLRAVMTSLKEGASVEEFFPTQAVSKTEAIKAKLAERKTLPAKSGEKPTDKPTEPPTVDPLPGLILRAGDELSPEAMYEWLGRNNFESLDAALAVTGERRAKLVASLENELAKAVEKKGAKK